MNTLNAQDLINDLRLTQGIYFIFIIESSCKSGTAHALVIIMMSLHIIVMMPTR